MDERGDCSPLFVIIRIRIYMIERNKIEQLLEEILTEKDLFLVSLKITPTNLIEVFVDSEHHQVGITECVAISRHIESNLDREVEDFELNVSSAGLDMPLSDKRQFVKNMGKMLRLQLNDGTITLFQLNEVTDLGIGGHPLKKNPNAKKGAAKQFIELDAVQIPFESISEAKIEVIF